MNLLQICIKEDKVTSIIEWKFCQTKMIAPSTSLEPINSDQRHTRTDKIILT